MKSNLTELAERYAAVWNEHDPAQRRKQIAALWTEDAVHYVQEREVRGHAALEARVIEAHEKWVVQAGYLFKFVGTVAGLHDSAKFNWVMLPKDGGDAISAGLNLLLLSDEGRILVDYMYNEPLQRAW
ncbi:nuclear transport factor 2 family protein [Undibacterium sp. Di26W]|uniref:nuclear transport factor 2 family protein n=1 Tax=Undibacterium sp. Di26W TaxID=3413035 RepID=UPI003BF013CB